MGLNVSTGNMYEFVTHTWNTIKGACPHDCSYCYMKRWGKLNPVRFDEKELKTDLGSGNFIFVGSSCDMFADDIPSDWIIHTLEKCREHTSTYLFQSKNPDRMGGFVNHYCDYSTVVCTTIETNRWYPDIMRNSPTTVFRAGGMAGCFSKYRRFVTIEPILDFDLAPMVELIKRCQPEQVNIGADSGNNHLPEPHLDKVLELIYELKKFTTVSKKRNLARLTGSAR